MGDSVRRAVVRAPGKLNLVMRVGGVQPDGYHDVATVYQALQLHEELTAERADDLSVAFSGPVDTAGLRTDEGNLVLRAARALQRRTGTSAGARITVVKRVPIAGGMGGGSADAAAALVALDALWGLGLGREDLLELAAGLGADVPFALTGGTAVGTRRGDVLTPVLTTGVFHWVVALSPEGLSTPDVYAALDLLRAERGEPAPEPRVEPAVLQALRSGDPFRLAPLLATDLQEAALRLRPGLAEVLALGTGNGALAGLVSGSGPSVAFLAEDLDAALALQIALSAARLTAIRSTGPAPGARPV